MAVLAALAVAVVAWMSARPRAPRPAPQPVLLGEGRAGVKDVAPVDSTPAVPEGPAETLTPVPGTPIGAGQASYYSDELAGNPTASGEPFNPDALTAAHRTLPLGSRLRVTNPKNGESVIVRVNDRGPFEGRRVVDLSERAAREIGLFRAGTGRVVMELLPKKAKPQPRG